MPTIVTIRLLLLATPLTVAVSACDAGPTSAGNGSTSAYADTISTTDTAGSVGDVYPVAEPSAAEPSDARPAPTPSPTPTDGAQRIDFPTGGTAVTIAGTTGGSDRRYAFVARRGQRTRISLSGEANALRYAIYAPDSGPGGPAMIRGATTARRFAATLPQDGRYLIQVYRAAGATPAGFHLSVAIDPPGTASNPTSTPLVTQGPPAAVIHDYYAAIRAGRFQDAYRHWEQAGEASDKSFADFRSGFDQTRDTRVHITGRVTIDGAAGSVYATVPVAVDATLRDGTHQHFTGTYVLRRIDDVPGSSAAERSWHLRSATLTRG